MAIKTQIDALLNEKMDRQEFLKHVAIGLVALSGLGSILRVATPKAGKAPVSGAGYGSSAYGGSNELKK